MKTTYKEIREIEEINLLIEQGNATLKELGYTEHSKKHAAKVSDTAGKILTELGYGKHKIELARIAGYMHDIGNSINRHDHAHSGALLAYQILKDTEMSLKGHAAATEEQSTKGESSSKDTWKQRKPKLKFTYKEQREFETIDDDIAKLEEKLETLDAQIAANATNSVKLRELMEKKEETGNALDEKMERWVYLNDLNEKIQNADIIKE